LEGSEIEIVKEAGLTGDLTLAGRYCQGFLKNKVNGEAEKRKRVRETYLHRR
jgi:hypothetical protein